MVHREKVIRTGPRRLILEALEEAGCHVRDAHVRVKFKEAPFSYSEELTKDQFIAVEIKGPSREKLPHVHEALKTAFPDLAVTQKWESYELQLRGDLKAVGYDPLAKGAAKYKNWASKFNRDTSAEKADGVSR